MSQSFDGELKIENITFPEGNQLAYAYDITQDTTGKMWFRYGVNFYNYNGHVLSQVPQEALGFTGNGMGRVIWGKDQDFFYLPTDSLIIYNPYTNKVIRGDRDKSEPTSIALNRAKLGKVGIIGLGKDKSIWGVVSVNGRTDEGGKYYVVKTDDKREFQIIDSLQISWYYDQTLVKGDDFYVKCRDRIEVFNTAGRTKVYSFPQGPDPVMPCMLLDDENTIWVVYSPDKLKDQYAVYYLKEGQSEFTRLAKGQQFPEEQKPSQIFHSNGYIWHWANPFSFSRMRISDGRIEDLTPKILEQKINFPFYNSTLLNVYEDRSGQIWLTTRAGIVKITIEEDLFKKYLPEQTSVDCQSDNCKVRGITEDDAGNIYLSSANGITVLDSKTGNIVALPLNISPQNQEVHALSYHDGTLFWNEYSINLENNTTQKIFTSSTYEYATHSIDQEENLLWIGVNDWPFRLYRYDIKKAETSEIPLPQHIFSSMNCEIKQIHYSKTTGSLFLAIWMRGILELDRDGNIINEYNTIKNTGSWHGNAMYDIVEDDSAQLWIGRGMDAGVSKMNLATREITRNPYELTPFIGSLKIVFRILTGKDNNLWLVTDKGTMSLDKSTGELTRFPMFPTLSEMAFYRLLAYRAKNGTLYIQTPDESLNVVNPEVLLKKAGFNKQYPIVIDRYERFNEKQDSLITVQKDLIHLSEIDLSYLDRYFTLHFFVPDYRKTNQILYSYWLEGYDADWSEPARINQLRYENLPHGKYILHIRGGLTPDFLASSERSITVIVRQAWYKSWWAWYLYLTAFFGVVYLIYQYQVRQQLEKAETKRLKELDTLKTRLYTNITHEFRTPLTVIMGMTNNIQGHEEERKLIQRNSKNLLRLINQLLDLSKLDSGTLKMDKIQSDVIHYLQYLTESFYSMAEEKQIRLTFYSEVKELVMDYDATKIQHIVYNLLTNAIKFTMEGGKVILHVTKVKKNNTDWLQLKVSDTGIGISKENLPKVFDRFFQGDGSSTRQEAGTGIGLALTKELIEMMDGHIVVDSKLAQGTDFLILLPIRLEKETLILQSTELDFDSKIQVPREESASRRVVPLDINTLHKNAEAPSLLIIEDNRDVATYIEGLLKATYRIELAKNGQEGIDKAFAIVPDIIISDVMMPEKDGYEVCAALKNDERTSHIPIILLTAKATTEDRVEGLKEGADAYLTKPFEKEELFIRLEKLVAIRKTLQERYSKNTFYTKEINATASTSLDDIFLQKLMKVVHPRINDAELSVADLCDAVHLSNTHVNRKLKALTGKTPSQFIREIRLQKALELLQTTDDTISEIAYQVGFNDPNYFSRSFSEEFGVSPKETRK